MAKCIIFDLSEVLIAGLVGIERELARKFPISAEELWHAAGGRPLDELFLGNVPEDRYLQQIIAREGWPVEAAWLKTVIRNNFHHEVDGSLAILEDLAGRYDCYLLSDHAREWIAYIKTIHPFLGIFKRLFFSFEVKGLKSDPATFGKVLEAIDRRPESCLFIDDYDKNVRVAASMGIEAIQFVSAEALATALTARGLL